MVIYTPEEYRDMLKTYYDASEDGALAANLYAQRYTNRENRPQARNFIRLFNRYDATSSVLVIFTFKL